MLWTQQWKISSTYTKAKYFFTPYFLFLLLSIRERDSAGPGKGLGLSVCLDTTNRANLVRHILVWAVG